MHQKSLAIAEAADVTTIHRNS